MDNKLPKIKLHIRGNVLEIPQNKKITLITFANQRDTLKESFLECYRSRVSEVKREKHIPYEFREITIEEIESQLIEDLKNFGDKFVFDKAWKAADSKILCDSQRSIYEWISDEEKLFEGKVEETEESIEISHEEQNDFFLSDDDFEK